VLGSNVSHCLASASTLSSESSDSARRSAVPSRWSRKIAVMRRKLGKPTWQLGTRMGDTRRRALDDDETMDDNVLPLRPGPEELVDDRYLLDTFLEHTPDSVYFKDDKSRFMRISRALAERLGLDDAATAIGKTDFDFFGVEHAREAFADEQRLIRTGESLIGIEERENWDDGREAWVSTTKVPLRDRAGRIVGLFGISRDITERRRNEQQLAAQAERLAEQARELEQLMLVDDLTGLFNRRGLQLVGEQALYKARRDGIGVVLLYLDLDGLKQINDRLGHSAGDDALRALADVIREVTRESDLAARIGGDEFAMLLFNEDGKAAANVVERIERGAAAARERHSLACDLSVSVGICEIDPRTPGSIEDLLVQADRSMYDEKLGGRATEPLELRGRRSA
jgi:diguanylate cyclase (GGDEF)-like protein/PAS domain S-box-containing protein